jgi:hypothetical protein
MTHQVSILLSFFLGVEICIEYELFGFP